MAISDDTKIGFLGAGKMATALARGWIDAKLISCDQILASDPFDAAATQFREITGCKTAAGNRDVCGQCNIIVLAVKPQAMAVVLDDIQSVVTDDMLVISIAAGVRLQAIAKGLAGKGRLVRVMPNTPCLVGESASAYTRGPKATDDDMASVGTLLNAVGRAFELPETLLDAVTGLSGSGPAFVYMAIEALSDGGVRSGLPRDVATVLAAQTVLGAAKMVLETKEHPAVLKDMVTSPGGTTIAGIHALEQNGFRASLMNAVYEATKRSTELGS